VAPPHLYHGGERHEGVRQAPHGWWRPDVCALVARFPDVHEVTNIGAIRYLNCFTCNARVPSSWRTGMLSLLVETRQGLVLVDTGPGLEDYDRKPGIIRIFPLVTKVPLDPGETAVRHITRLGYRPEDVRHIVLTHMHFDHCGGLPDFP